MFRDEFGDIYIRGSGSTFKIRGDEDFGDLDNFTPTTEPVSKKEHML
jgi:hypothetical protein